MMILMTGSTGYVGKYFIQEYSNIYKISTFSLRSQALDELDLKGTETVIHLAALVHQMNGASLVEYNRINYQYTIDLAKKAKKAKIKHFIFMSTLAVYDENIGVITEDSACIPTTDYGKSKYKAEKKLLELDSDDFIVSIIRAPMIYGFDAPGNIKSLIKIINKIPILPFYGIDNARSFIYISNLTNMIDKILKLKVGGVFLAADDKPISTTELMELLGKSLGKKLFLIKLPFFPTVLKKLKPTIYSRLYDNLEVDNSYTKMLLDLKNPYSIEEGIRECSKICDNT